MKLKSTKIVEALKERAKVNEEGLPYFDEIEKLVTKVVKNNMPRIATCPEMWKYLKPYVDEKEYSECNGKLAEIYRQLQKLEYKMTRLKDKITAELKKEKIELKEFEEIGSVKLVGEIAEVDIIDKIESYKEMLREKNAR